NCSKMPFEFLFKELLQQASTSGSRSTAMKPLTWLVGILIVGVISLAASGATFWLLVTVAFLLVIAVVAFMSSYIYFMVKNPDALRSERFTLSKMKIEKNLIGDDKSGLKEIPEFAETKTISALPAKSEVAE
ncbi:MAG: hypothetical protein LC778_20860, partial [Acidobacteria bacterium]|nr:hypothetical protein [Acidobacteriota bacterium]